MWHPFDILGDELFVDKTLRDSDAPSHCRLVYSERITRWFKDKSDQNNQWPPTVDRKPGVQISRRIDGDRMRLEVLHEWQLMIRHLLSATMDGSARGWRSPESWSAQVTFSNIRNGREFLPEIRETGSWSGGRLEQVSQGAENSITQSGEARSLASVYALLANFPRPDEISSIGSTTLLEEGFTVTPDVTLLRCPENLQKHPMAAGLDGYALRGKGNFPADYWVNRQGLVVFVCMGPHRAFVLESLETLPS